MKGASAIRSRAMISSTSLASSVSTPSTAFTCWMGTETETTRSPLAARRMPETIRPLMALPTSLFSSALAWATTFGLAPSVSACRLKAGSPRLRAGGSTFHSTRSEMT